MIRKKTCNRCNTDFEEKKSEEELKKEFERLYPDLNFDALISGKYLEIVCPKCYKDRNKWFEELPDKDRQGILTKYKALNPDTANIVK